MKWTDDQQKAIELRGKNMLVAAAAGSGKTAVLVERIKELIIKDRVSVDEMLVVTFTNAAAAEMREKINKAIMSQLQEGNGDVNFLQRQLNIMYKANISTFHAFALEVIRRYFYCINIEPNFKVCDEAESKIMKGNAVDRLFEEEFELENEKFKDFLDQFAKGKTFEGVKQLIISSYDILQSVPEPLKWLETNLVKLNMTPEEFTKSESYKFMKIKIISNLKNAVFGYESAYNILVDHGLNNLAEKVNIELDYCQRLSEVFTQIGYNDFGKAIAAKPQIRLVAKKEEKEEYSLVKDTVKEIRDKASAAVKELREEYFAYSLEDYISELNETYKVTEYFAELLKRFGELYRIEKDDVKLIDFSDIEHFALSILKNKDVADEYRNKFKYIFIDEYQDSNIIQETLIGTIKRNNNLFMVGDVKQSIYKFRLAEPEIFMKKYLSYRDSIGGNDEKIDLNKNFRSKGNVIKTTNDMFSKTMDGYDEAAALYKGVDYEGSFDYPTELHLVDKMEKIENVDDEIKELKKAELEAYVVADIIKKAIGLPIFDTVKMEERPLTKKDIVILMRGTKNTAEIFHKILNENDIAAHMNDSNGYFDTIEIDVFLNLLRIIDNKKQDIPFISVLYSVIFNFSIDELVEIRLIEKKSAFYKAFFQYTEEGKDTKLKEKCKDVYKRLKLWKELAACTVIDELVWQLMWETGYYAYAGALPTGIQRQANLRALVDKANVFARNHGGSIYEFLNYIDKVKEKDVATGQVKLVSENDDVVKIMTIHKSKGLEYPMVIVSGLGKRFNYTRDRASISIHKDIGIAAKLVNYKEHWYKKTILQKIIESQADRESAEEELRILYVAFTRAKDKLVLTGTYDKAAENIEKYKNIMEPDILNASKYLDVIIPAIGNKIEIKKYGIDEVSSMIRGTEENQKNLQNMLDEILEDNGQGKRGRKKEIYKRLSYKYPYKNQLTRKSKYTVSELNQISKGIAEANRNTYEKSIATPSFMLGKMPIKSAEKGTIYHTIMEHLDMGETWEKLQESEESCGVYVVKFLDGLAKKQILTEEEIQAVNIKKPIKFLQSDLGKRVAAASKMGRLYREKPFTLKVDFGGEEVLTQGIIDCFFEETAEDGSSRYVLLDYKTNYLEKNSEDEIEKIKETYRAQMDIYKTALEKIRGVDVFECYLYLFGIDKAIMM